MNRIKIFNACKEGNLEELIKFNDFSIINSHGENILMLSVVYHHYHICNYIIDNIDTYNYNHRNKLGQSVLMYLAKEDTATHLNIIMQLMNKGYVCIRMIDLFGFNTLMYTIKYNCFNIFKYVIQYNNLAQQTNDGWTPLMCAAYRGRYEMLCYILDYSNGNDYTQQSPLIYQYDNEGVSSLLYACQNGSIECVNRLYEEHKKDNQFDIKLFTNDIYCNSIDYAIIYGHFELLKYFIDTYNIKINNRQIILIIQKGHIDMLIYVVQAATTPLEQEKVDETFDINYIDEENASFLIHAVNFNQVEIAQYLIKNNINKTHCIKKNINAYKLSKLKKYKEMKEMLRPYYKSPKKQYNLFKITF